MDDTAELIERLRSFADGDVREIGRELCNGTLSPDRKDFANWAELMEDAATRLSILQAESDSLRDARRKDLESYCTAIENVYRDRPASMVDMLDKAIKAMMKVHDEQEQ